MKLILVVVASLGLLYVLIGFGVNQIAQRIPDQTEASVFSTMGLKMLQTSEKRDSNPISQHTPEFLRAKEIFARLTSHGGLRALPYDLMYLESPDPNAFAVPGGGIGVTDGLLKLVRGEIGIAMVLAHELGHHQNRDPLRTMGRGMAFSVMTSVIFGGNNFFGSSALSLAEKAHSRNQELAADRTGFRLVKATFGRTEGVLEFYEQAEKNPRTKSMRGLTMLSTHPYTPDRVAAIREMQKKK